MRRVIKAIFPKVLGVALFSLTACASRPPEIPYSPDDLPKLTSCATPLILRHKTVADITTLDKERRLSAVGLSLYGDSSKGRDLSGKSITYSDSLTKGEACPQTDITTHYVTSIADFESYVEAKRDVRPIYVRHLKSSDIERDKNIQCSGVFNHNDKLNLSGKTLTMPSYNEELCWRR